MGVVCLSVCLSVAILSPAKTTEQIAMSFGMFFHVSSRNCMLDGVQITHAEG